MGKSSGRVFKDKEFFRFLLDTSYEQQKALLLTATDSQIKGISEIYFNLYEVIWDTLPKTDRNLLVKRSSILQKFYEGKKSVSFKHKHRNQTQSDKYH